MEFKSFKTENPLYDLYKNVSIPVESTKEIFSRTTKKSTYSKPSTPARFEKTHLNSLAFEKNAPRKGDQQSFFQRLQSERKRILSKRKEEHRTKKPHKSGNSSKKLPHLLLNFTQEAKTPIIEAFRFLTMSSNKRKTWVKSKILELSIFSNQYVPVSIYDNTPDFRSKGNTFVYKKGMLNIIQACEKRSGYKLLTNTEKSRLMGGTLSFITMTQLSYNRLIRLT